MTICIPRVFGYRDLGLYVTYGHDCFNERLSALQTISATADYFFSFHRKNKLETGK